MLYPLKFEPIYKERIWGGTKLRDKYNRITPKDKPIGESWELSGLDGDLSVVANGALAGNDIRELIEVYMGDLVGERVYNRYGEEFPLLVKLLDAAETLSVQVHPDDPTAAERHDAYGKSEMWYVMEADKGAQISLGFNKDVNKSQYLDALEGGKIDLLLRHETPRKGSIYYIPSGTIHAIGKGVMVAEIQQTSDITYRVFDWNRTDDQGNGRELHTDLAMDVLNFEAAKGLDVTQKPECNRAVEFLDTPNFVANLIEIDGKLERDYAATDSFVIYVCLEGEVIVECSGGAESMVDAETVLLPAIFEEATLSGKGKLLEITMPKP